jgi:mRNA interferase RelE/StbE
MARYKVLVKPSADRALRKLPATVQKRIVVAIAELADDPRPPGAVKLSGEEDLWRIRVGSYRVVYEIRDAMLLVMVLRIAHRKDVYR